MSTKTRRHEELRRILRSGMGSTHEEMLERLEKRGISASQSTLSRDLRDLKAVKLRRENGVAFYRLADPGKVAPGGLDIASARKEYVTEIQEIANFLVIRTSPGNARDFCLVLDRQAWKEIVGTIAGDDTILVIARTVKDAKLVNRNLTV